MAIKATHINCAVCLNKRILLFNWLTGLFPFKSINVQNQDYCDIRWSKIPMLIAITLVIFTSYTLRSQFKKTFEYNPKLLMQDYIGFLFSLIANVFVIILTIMCVLECKTRKKQYEALNVILCSHNKFGTVKIITKSFIKRISNKSNYFLTFLVSNGVFIILFFAYLYANNSQEIYVETYIILFLEFLNCFGFYTCLTQEIVMYLQIFQATHKNIKDILKSSFKNKKLVTNVKIQILGIDRKRAVLHWDLKQLSRLHCASFKSFECLLSFLTWYVTFFILEMITLLVACIYAVCVILFFQDAIFFKVENFYILYFSIPNSLFIVYLAMLLQKLEYEVRFTSGYFI